MKKEYTEICNHPFIVKLKKELAKYLKKNFKRKDFDVNHFLNLCGWGTKELKVKRKSQTETPIFYKLLFEIFRKVMEIDQCLKFLRYDIFRVRNISSDYRFGVGKRLQKGEYFYFHIYHLLEETYTIKERMTKLFAIIKNFLKKHRHNSRRANQLLKELDKLMGMYIKVMKFATDPRRSQTHDMNITIEEVEQFGRAEFFLKDMSISDKEIRFVLRYLTNMNFEQAQKKCLKLMRDYNRNIRKILEAIFTRFEVIIFHDIQTMLKESYKDN